MPVDDAVHTSVGPVSPVATVRSPKKERSKFQVQMGEHLGLKSNDKRDKRFEWIVDEAINAGLPEGWGQKVCCLCLQGLR